MSTQTLPARMQEIVEDFQMCEGQEKLELLLEYADRMPPLPAHLQEKRANMETVPECMTPIFIHAEMEDGGMVFYFDVPPESPTVRGYASVLREGLHGITPEQVLVIPLHLYEHIGIDKLIGPQRLNGLAAMLVHVKRLAYEQVQSG